MVSWPIVCLPVRTTHPANIFSVKEHFPHSYFPCFFLYFLLSFSFSLGPKISALLLLLYPTNLSASPPFSTLPHLSPWIEPLFFIFFFFIFPLIFCCWHFSSLSALSLISLILSQMGLIGATYQFWHGGRNLHCFTFRMVGGSNPWLIK